ncbi:hypothetical protein BGX21_011107 [Mortierella sp. AD011]|nr:hypothetical protein BGX20_006663 [Mortierella sp. AD010]KAF9391999.1 hypothetical protein BGX21_011107 [Mortierella sp. AD011]
MLYSGVVACLISLSTGYVIGSPNIPEAAIRGHDGACGPSPYTIHAGFPNCFEFSDLLWGFAVGSFCLGACVGGLISGGIQNKVGRIKTMLLSDFVFILGALTLGLTYHQAQFIIGRIIVGFACGIGGVVAPTYLGEIATIQGRGTLGAFHQLFVVIGIVISNLVGLAWSSPPGWRVVFAANAIPALLQCFLLPSLVESPKYLVSRNQLKEAKESLQKLRGPEAEVDVHQELDEMIALLLGDHVIEEAADEEEEISDPASKAVQGIPIVRRGDSLATVKTQLTLVPTRNAHENMADAPSNDSQDSYGIIELFRSECCGLAIIGILVHFLQQASGINGLVYYSTSFLANVFGTNNSKYITVGISFCSLLSTAASVFLINRLNRKALMMTSFVGLNISSLLLVIGAYCNVGILVVVAVFLYIATFAVALGPIPWLLLPELLPTYAVSPASSVATGVNWGTNFVVGLVFPSMTKAMGSGTFLLFGAINVFGVFYIWRFVPETRGRSIEAIMAECGVPQRSKS